MTVLYSNPRTVHDCPLEKPVYTSCCTRLCSTTTHIRHAIVLYSKPRIQGHTRDCAQRNPHVLLKNFQRKNTRKDLWAHYTVNQKQDKNNHTQN